jgi:hypothetical protein
MTFGHITVCSDCDTGWIRKESASDFREGKIFALLHSAQAAFLSVSTAESRLVGEDGNSP